MLIELRNPNFKGIDVAKLTYPPESYVKFSPPSPVVLVTCISKEGKPNIITIGMYMPISFRPPLLIIGVSPKRYSHKLIRETGEFAINVPPKNLVKQAIYCGTHSGLKVDKFKETGLTPIPARVVKPPLIKECLAHFECKLYAAHEAGDHTIFVGEVVSVTLEENLEREGLLNVLKAEPISHRGKYYYIPKLHYKAE